MDVLLCSVCSAATTPGTPLLLCGRCKSVRYCGPECQKADWKMHKQDCKRFADEAKDVSTSAADFSESSESDELRTAFMGINPAFAAYASASHGRDPPETYRSRPPLVPGGPPILPGWGAALSYKKAFMSPVENAVSDANPKALQALLASDSDPHARDAMTAWTPLHYAAMHSTYPSPTGKASKAILACFKLLLEAGVDPNACSKTRNTPLHNTVNFAHHSAGDEHCAAAMGLLLHAGGDPTLPDEAGNTCVSLLRRYGLERSHPKLSQLIKTWVPISSTKPA